MTFRVIDGGRPDELPFVCTACGRKCADHAELEGHWEFRPECRQSLGRPIGTFDPPKIRTTKCCLSCHDRAMHGAESPPCPMHVYRGCPGC